MLLWPELGRGLVQLGHTLVDQSVVLSSHAGFGSSFGSVGCASWLCGNLLLREDGRVPGWAWGDRAGSDLEGEKDWTGIGRSWRYGFVNLSLIEDGEARRKFVPLCVARPETTIRQIRRCMRQVFPLDEFGAPRRAGARRTTSLRTDSHQQARSVHGPQRDTISIGFSGLGSSQAPGFRHIGES